MSVFHILHSEGRVGGEGWRMGWSGVRIGEKRRASSSEIECGWEWRSNKTNE